MYQRRIKPMSDAIMALLLLCILAPVLCILTLTGAVFMRGRPFFVQNRIGWKERPFRIIKFRTMTQAKDASGRLLPDERRLTAYGRFLRKTSLDELPELLNILKGEMSFVGPRPLLPEYLPFYTEEERLRHTVRPGLTGLAQVNGRTNIDCWEDRFRWDLEYVRRCGFRLDCRILCKTAVNVLRRKDVLTGSEIRAGRLDEARGGGQYGNHDQTVPGDGYPG